MTVRDPGGRRRLKPEGPSAIVLTLPPIIPLFPLPNVVFFPRMLLPLHVFEPRYRAMVRDATDGAGLIGMILLREDWERDYYGRPQTFRTGTVGQITQVEPLEGGRFDIVLLGAREFRVEEEFFERPYRQARVAWRPPCEGPVLSSEEREQLASLTCLYLEGQRGLSGSALVGAADVDDEVFVNFLSQGLNFTLLEKQGLLESPSLLERARRLCEVLEFRIEERRLRVPAAAGSRQTH
jgi:hypothetical protein